LKTACKIAFISKNLVDDVKEILIDGSENIHENDPIEQMMPE